MIDLAKLQSPLAAFADDPEEGGSPGHVSIVPIDSQGEPDLQFLEEWAAARESGHTHPLTQLLIDAVVQNDVGGMS